ncbi:cell division protein ZipA C-terminal FtsZ-binding domain-containing protein [Aquimarina sp. AU58]|uniref:cell division protein ZipA C-terminal FtsZ-binding domain-containing protein n=1 Tax=Aquimarina sp. AU58 TaxID=1874112 RepID=UPI000D6DE573|nr:cell division protein ZipA C-terminal FtsZ-binding domain-containing protein [Aquimarina sp. AU58]
MTESPFNREQHILIRAASNRQISIKEWVESFISAGLNHGDGDLFWMYKDSFHLLDDKSEELFCAEPYTKLGYFHPLDWNNEVDFFPDVSLHFRISDYKNPVDILKIMFEVAEKIAQKLNAELLNSGGLKFELHKEIERTTVIHDDILLRRIFGEK